MSGTPPTFSLPVWPILERGPSAAYPGQNRRGGRYGYLDTDETSSEVRANPGTAVGNCITSVCPQVSPLPASAMHNGSCSLEFSSCGGAETQWAIKEKLGRKRMPFISLRLRAHFTFKTILAVYEKYSTEPDQRWVLGCSAWFRYRNQ